MNGLVQMALGLAAERLQEKNITIEVNDRWNFEWERDIEYRRILRECEERTREWKGR